MELQKFLENAGLAHLTECMLGKFFFFTFNSSHTDDTDSEQNSTLVDTFRLPTPPPPPTKKRRITQLSSMVGQLKEIADTTNSTVEENEFEVFGKHVGLQLKSLPLLSALEAQEHIQLHLNRIRRRHILNASDQNRIPQTPQSSYATGSQHNSDSSIYYSDISNYNLGEQATQYNSSSILLNHTGHVADYQLSSNMLPSNHLNNNETQSDVTIVSNDLVFTAMRNANVDNEE
ncbi:hypothetical protein ACJJTC_002752 [Scirpophaga incertulas]